MEKGGVPQTGVIWGSRLTEKGSIPWDWGSRLREKGDVPRAGVLD